MSRISEQITDEEIIRIFTEDKEMSLTKLAERIGANRGNLYKHFKKHNLLYLLPAQKADPNRVIKKDIKQVARQLQEYEKGLQVQTPTQVSEEDLEMFRINSERVAKRGPVTPMGEAFSYLYHIKRFFLKFVADYEKRSEMIEKLYEKNIAMASELTAGERQSLFYAIQAVSDTPRVAGSIKKVTDSAKEMWELVMETQSKSLIDPQVIMQILVKHLRGGATKEQAEASGLAYVQAQTFDYGEKNLTASEQVRAAYEAGFLAGGRIGPNTLMNIAADFRKVKADFETQTKGVEE